MYSGVRPSVYPCTLGRKGRGRCRSWFRVCERYRSRSLRVCCVGGSEGWRMEDVRVEDTVTDRADWNTVRGGCVRITHLSSYEDIEQSWKHPRRDETRIPYQVRYSTAHRCRCRCRKQPPSHLRRGRRRKRRAADSGISKCARGMVSKAQQRTVCSHGLSQIPPPRRLNSMLADGGCIPWSH